MASRRRYTFRDVPEAAAVPLSFRVPESAAMLLSDRVAKLIAAGEIRNRSEALQDALVTWLMVEEYEEQRTHPPQEVTSLEDIVANGTTPPGTA